MFKEEYIRKLERALRKLPRQDREDAVEYYKEYFEDAGAEKEQEIIKELGSPEELAKKIIIECAEKKYDEQSVETDKNNTGNKAKLDTMWIVLLAICTLPVSPLILAFVILLCVIVGAIFIIIGTMILTGIVVAMAGLVVSIMGIVLIFTHPANGTLMTGSGLLAMAIGILFFIGFVVLWNEVVHGCIYLGHKLLHRNTTT